MTRYYADLNPRFPGNYEKRWAVFCLAEGDSPRMTVFQFATRKAAERNAAALEAAGHDPIAKRTNRALAAMRAYTGNRDWYLGVPDAGTDLTDLLADLMHLYGVDSVDGAYESASWHFQKEIEESGS